MEDEEAEDAKTGARRIRLELNKKDERVLVLHNNQVFLEFNLKCWFLQINEEFVSLEF